MRGAGAVSGRGGAGWRAWLAAAVLALAAACATTAQETAYYRGEELRDQLRDVSYQLAYDTDANLFRFQEGPVSLTLRVYVDRDYRFGLSLHNRSGRPLLIAWNRAEYLDVAGGVHSLIHQGVGWYSPVAVQRPTLVPAGASYQDLLIPADRRVVDGVLRLVPPADTPAARGYYDSVTLVLPVRVEGRWRRYRLVLQVGMVSPAAVYDPGWE